MINFETNPPNEYMESYLKYLSFIQDVITRMNRNSFQLKGWCATIVTALLAAWVRSQHIGFLIVAAVAVIPFWGLDAYYLLMERQFRGLYTDVVKGCAEIKVFTMPIDRYTRSKATNEKDKTKYSYRCVIYSSTLISYYLPLFLGCITWAIIAEVVHGA